MAGPRDLRVVLRPALGCAMPRFQSSKSRLGASHYPNVAQRGADGALQRALCTVASRYLAEICTGRFPVWHRAGFRSKVAIHVRQQQWSLTAGPSSYCAPTEGLSKSFSGSRALSNGFSPSGAAERTGNLELPGEGRVGKAAAGEIVSPQRLTKIILRCNNTKQLVQCLEEYRTSLNPIHLNAAWKKLGMFRDVRPKRRGGSSRWKELGDELGAIREGDTPLSMINALESLGERHKMRSMAGTEDAEGIRDGNFLARRLTRLSMASVGALDARNAVHLLHSTCKLHAYGGIPISTELLGAISKRIAQVVDDLAPQGVGNVFWAFGTMGPGACVHVSAPLLARAEITLPRCNAQEVSNTAWGLARLHMSDVSESTLADALQERALATMPSFEPQGIANLAWAFGKLRIEPRPELLQAVMTRTLETAHLFEPQNISNFMLGFANLAPVDFDTIVPENTARYISVEVIKALQDQAMSVISDFKAQEVASFNWALAAMRVRLGEDLGLAFQNVILEKTEDFSPHELATLTWATARQGSVFYFQVWEAIMTRAGRPEVMNHFTAKELACLSWGLGCAQVYVTPEFLDALQRRALELAPEFSCMGLGMLWYGIGILAGGRGAAGPLLPGLLDALQAQQAVVADELQAHHLGNLAFALAQLLIVPPGPARIDHNLFDRMLERVMAIGKDNFDTISLVSFHQLFLSCELDPLIRKALPPSVLELIDYLANDAREAFATTERCSPARAAELAEVLREEFPWMRIEEMAADMATGYVVSIRFGSSGRTHLGHQAGLVKPEWAPKGASGWIVEYDAPERFLTAGEDDETGNYKHTGVYMNERLMKFRHLARVGYTVISVPSAEWDDKSYEERIQLLQTKFQQVGRGEHFFAV